MTKIILSTFILFFLVWLTGCSDNPTDSSTGGIGGGISTGISFSIMCQDGENGGMEFLCKPNVDVTLTSVNVKVPDVNFDETYECDGVTVYTKNNWQVVNEYTGVETGMKFVFNFIGKTSPDNKDFNVTTNYTVP